MDYRGRAFIYVLVAAGAEDLLKVGMTQNPLARWAAFHERWFEVFDLDHSLLVETETRSDAQALETTLHRLLADHACPVPMAIDRRAGGFTEWYRGASAITLDFVVDCQKRGYVAHLPARPVLASSMLAARGDLDETVRSAYEAQLANALMPRHLASLRVLVAAHRAFGVEIDARFPADVIQALGLED